MNKSAKTCPQCKGANVKLVKPIGQYVCVRLGLINAAMTDFYVCLDCGFCQFWVSPENLPKVREKYKSK